MCSETSKQAANQQRSEASKHRRLLSACARWTIRLANGATKLPSALGAEVSRTAFPPEETEAAHRGVEDYQAIAHS
eukprot:11636431-Alexandrium_andersonii.AAC.1